jgi:hypothetical protein
MLDQRVQIAGEGVVVVADGRLVRAAETPPVVGDDTESVSKKLALLTLPGIPVKWVTVDQDDRIALAGSSKWSLIDWAFSVPTVILGTVSASL